ncbi:MAG: SDR family oxidoreductase [Pelagimonas sp.]|uniref:SDR family oxidoreductase n=1 Tax=Pelagimonas sp. TaxID=2073170 RepID=UPI003D6B29C0
MPNLNNKRIVVTGITGGIANATVQRLLKSGASVIVSARTQEKLDAALATLDGDITGHVMDLASEDSIAAFFEKVGEFDHLITPAASSMFAPIAEMDMKAAREILETKQWGQMLCVHYGSKMISKTGSITVFSGTVTQKPLPGSTMFAAVGAASEASARVWGLELAPVRVNSVVPGIIETPIWGNLMGDAASDTLGSIAESLPVGRVGSADDVAKAVEFLIDNEFVNGHALVVDGGHRLI